MSLLLDASFCTHLQLPSEHRQKKVLNSVEEKRIKKDIPLKKLGKASDVSYLVCFLCSDFNNYITGQNFIIDGGYTSK